MIMIISIIIMLRFIDTTICFMLVPRGRRLHLDEQHKHKQHIHQQHIQTINTYTTINT